MATAASAGSVTAPGRVGGSVTAPAPSEGTTIAGLGPPWSTHLFLLEGVGRWRILRSWVLPGGVVVDTTLAEGGRAAVSVGDAAAVAPVVADLLREPSPPALLSLPRGVWQALPSDVAAASGVRRTLDWDWLVCAEAPPPQRGEERVAPLVHPDERRDAARLLEVAYPSGWKVATNRPDQRWWGVRDAAGALVGCAGARRLSSGGPVRLGGVATLPDARRRGIAAALTAAVTREALGSAPWVSLAIRADNEPARALYLRLGFRVEAELETLRRDGPS